MVSERMPLVSKALSQASVSAPLEKGWGIGLTLVQWVTVAHGGRVCFESTLEAWTIFTVILPKKPSNEITNNHTIVRYWPRVTKAKFSLHALTALFLSSRRLQSVSFGVENFVTSSSEKKW